MMVNYYIKQKLKAFLKYWYIFFKLKILNQKYLKKECVLNNKKINLYVGTQESNMDNFISSDGLYEPWVTKYLELASSFVGKDKDAIDIGANVGIMTLLLSDLQKEAKVIAFEPLDLVYTCLKKNVEDNKRDNIILEKLIVSDRSEEELFINTISGENIGGSFVSSNIESHLESTKVRTITLDNYLDNLTSQIDIKLIKIDVECWEKHVLQGAKETIKKFQPIVLLEFNVGSRSLKVEKEGFELYLLIRDLFKYIYLIDRLTSKIVQVSNYSDLRAMMLTGHFVEDLLCFNDDNFFEFLKEHISQEVFSCYHGARVFSLKNKKSCMNVLEYYPDNWSYGHNFFIKVYSQTPINIQLSFFNKGPFEENSLVICKGNKIEELTLQRDIVLRNYQFDSNCSSLYIFVEKVFLAKDYMNINDPRELGIQIEIEEL